MAVLTFDIDRERRDIDVSKQIADYLPDESPFTVILMKARKKTTDTAEFQWYEQDVGGYWTQINKSTGYTTTDTALIVDDASIFAAKDVVKVARTGEVMLVNSVDTGTNTITVTRGYGVTAAATILDNDWLVRLGNAMEENSSAPAPKLSQPVKVVNYTQIFRTPFDGSMTADAERLKTSESERNRLRRLKIKEHRMDIERALLFGEKKEDVTNKRRMTGGILSFVKTNVIDAGGTLTEQEFETSFCETLFKYGSQRKLLVASPRVISVINQFAQGKLQTVVGDETYGVRVTRYLSAHGELLIVKSMALEKEYAGYAFGLDMDNIWYRPLAGRDSMLRTNIQNNDVDGWKDEYLTEAGLMLQLEKTHAVLKGVTG